MTITSKVIENIRINPQNLKPAHNTFVDRSVIYFYLV